MKRFYVTFGMGGILRGYHAIFEASSIDIIHAYCNKHFKGLWSNVYEKEPDTSKRLREEPEMLWYGKADHV